MDFHLKLDKGKVNLAVCVSATYLLGFLHVVQASRSVNLLPFVDEAAYLIVLLIKQVRRGHVLIRYSQRKEHNHENYHDDDAQDASDGSTLLLRWYLVAAALVELLAEVQRIQEDAIDQSRLELVLIF